MFWGLRCCQYNSCQYLLILIKNFLNNKIAQHFGKIRLHPKNPFGVAIGSLLTAATRYAVPSRKELPLPQFLSQVSATLTKLMATFIFWMKPSEGVWQRNDCKDANYYLQFNGLLIKLNTPSFFPFQVNIYNRHLFSRLRNNRSSIAHVKGCHLCEYRAKHL